jgi:hypothetical protein
VPCSLRITKHLTQIILSDRSCISDAQFYGFPSFDVSVVCVKIKAILLYQSWIDKD